MGEFPLSVVALAYDIAVRELRSCYDEHGIVAGRHHYDDYWTRDAGFGWLGALELGDYDVVGRHLNFLASLQRADGMIPFLVRRHLSPFSGFGIKIKTAPRPKFRSHKALYFSEVIDSNPFFTIGLAGLRQHSGQEVFLAEFQPYLVSALDWCRRKVGQDGLVREGFLAGWNDGIMKSGATLLNNVLFYRALSLWPDGDQESASAGQRIKEALQRDFFNGRYFIDWIDRRPHDHFDSIANFLTVIWGIADREQAEKILNFSFGDWLFTPPLVKTAFPPYAPSRVEIGNRIAGISGYWGGSMYWLEPACLMALALAETGRRAEAYWIIGGLAELIVRHQGIYEVYERDGDGFRPVRRRIFRSEHPFARSSGLFILACRRLGIG